MLFDCELKETIAVVSQLVLAGVRLVARSFQKSLRDVRQPFSVAEGVAIVREPAVSAVIVHALEKWGVFRCVEAILDEQLGQLLQVILGKHKPHLIFGALRVVLKQTAAAEVSEVIHELAFLGLDFKQGRLSSVIPYDSLHLFQIRLYSTRT